MSSICTRILLWTICFVSVLSLGLPRAAWADDSAQQGIELVLPAASSAIVAGLLDDVKGDRPGMVFGPPDIEGTTIRFRLVSQRSEALLGQIILRPKLRDVGALRVSQSFAIDVQQATPGSDIARMLDAAVDAIVNNDEGGIYLAPAREFKVQEDHGPTESEEPLLPFMWVVLSLAALVGVGLILIRTWTGRLQVGVTFKITHALPSTLQLTIFAYWSVYWSGVGGLLLSLVIQLLYAILLEAAIGLVTRKRWEVGFGVFPIVLSTNLFVQFPLQETLVTIVMLTLALLSKAFIQRAGKHIFNPSAFGVAVVGAVNVFWPGMGQGDHSWNFGGAPNMTELVMMVAIVVQFRLPIVLISISAFLGLTLLTLWDLETVRPTWAPMFLIITLLVTDPSTIPKTPLGKVFFGFTFGVSSGLLGVWMKSVWGNDFYSKILMVLPVNAARHQFDRLGERITKVRWFPSQVLAPRYNVAHMICWWALVVGTLAGHAKEEVFLAMDPGDRPYLVREDDGGLSCDSNELYCRPFSFDREIVEWTR